MKKIIALSTVLGLSAPALAAPCVFTGSKADFIACVSQQAGDNEDDIALLFDGLDDLSTGFVSISGAALRVDRPGNALGGLVNGASYADDLGDTFTFASVELPHGATIDSFECTLLDDDPVGYVQASLSRADMDDPSVLSTDIIGSSVTWPATASPDYTRTPGSVDVAFALIDNERFTYVLRVDLLDVTSTAADVALQGCTFAWSR